jgi:hypothetical protein
MRTPSPCPNERDPQLLQFSRLLLFHQAFIKQWQLPLFPATLTPVRAVIDIDNIAASGVDLDFNIVGEFYFPN